MYCLTETWLNDEFLNNELFNNKYLVFRNDNNPLVSGKTRGGGVLISIDKRHSVIGQSSRLSTISVTALALPVSIFCNKYILCVVYFDPNANLYDYKAFYDFCYSVFDTLSCEYSMFICGDFNISKYVNFISNYESHSSCFNEFSAFCQNCSLTQLNTVRNSNNRILDLVLTGFPLQISRCLTPPVSEDLHHPALVVSFTLKENNQPLKPQPCHSFDFKNADFLNLYNSLNSCDFSNLYSEPDPNKAIQNFYSHIYQAMYKTIPNKLKLFDPKYPSYFSKNIINKIKLKINYT